MRDYSGYGFNCLQEAMLKQFLNVNMYLPFNSRAKLNCLGDINKLQFLRVFEPWNSNLQSSLC